MDFIIESLQSKDFQNYFNMKDSQLESLQIVKQIATKKSGSPWRITLEDSEVGEEVLLLNFEYHSVNSAYKASGPIYVRIKKNQKICEINEVPEMFISRLISIRGYYRKKMLIFADIFEGNKLKEKIQKIFENPEIHYLHIHHAKHGCYFAKATRI